MAPSRAPAPALRPGISPSSTRFRQIDRTGAYAYSGEVEVEFSGIPTEALMVQTYPNPFDPATTVAFRSSTSGPMVVRVFNLLGQHVATLFEGTIVAGTTVQRSFEATHLPSGLYIVRAEQAGHSRSAKLLFSR